jgi:hypothetical protein
MCVVCVCGAAPRGELVVRVYMTGVVPTVSSSSRSVLSIFNNPDLIGPLPDALGDITALRCALHCTALHCTALHIGIRSDRVQSKPSNCWRRLPDCAVVLMKHLFHCPALVHHQQLPDDQQQPETGRPRSLDTCVPSSAAVRCKHNHARVATGVPVSDPSPTPSQACVRWMRRIAPGSYPPTATRSRGPCHHSSVSDTSSSSTSQTTQTSRSWCARHLSLSQDCDANTSRSYGEQGGKHKCK